MKQPIRLAISAMVGLSCVSVTCQGDDSKKSPSEAESVIKRFDQDGDGRLNASELAQFLTSKTFGDYGKSSPSDTITWPEALATNLAKAAVQTNLYRGPLGPRDMEDAFKLRSLPEPPSLLDRVGETFKLQYSYLTPDQSSSEPARLAWTVSRRDASYSFNGALSYVDQDVTSRSFLGGTLQWRPTFEAHVSNDKNAESDSLALGVPLEFIHGYAGAHFLQGWTLSLTPYFETDSSFEVKTFAVRPLWTPSIPDLGLGQDLRLFGDVKVRWRPFVGFELGRVIDDGGNALFQDNQSFYRFVLEAHGRLLLNKGFSINGRIGHRILFSQDRHAYTYGEISPVLALDKAQHVSVGATLKTGKTTPKFKDVHSANLWIGLKF